MKEYDLELATEFLLIAAILVELKRDALLPSGNKIDPDDEFGLWEERDLLLAKLVECKTFKEAAYNSENCPSRLHCLAEASWS